MGKIFDALQKATPKLRTDLARDDLRIDNGKIHPSSETAAVEPAVDDETQARSPIDGKPQSPRLPEAEQQGRPADERGRAKTISLLPLQQLDKSLVVVHEPHSYEAEQFRMLRTNLLFPKSGRPTPRTLLVTSALPGEGKSFVSANLAAIIAQNVDHHVLLIDADMRNPTIHRLFGMRKVSGLSDYLNRGLPISELLQRGHTQRLTLLPGGPPPSNPAELLSSRRMAALLQEVKNRYDDRYIIIDSPPPHLTSESNALAKFVEGIVVVVKVNSTPRELVTGLIAKFEQGKVVGIVANRVERGTQLYYGTDKYAKHYTGEKSRGL